MKVSSGQKSYIGKEREANEDSIRSDDDLGLYVVADGVSIKPKGEVASRMAVDEIFSFVRKKKAEGDIS